MDPLSHALIGLAVYTSQNPLSLANPACIGAMVGAVAPDFDIITKLKGDYVYYKHHRVESHSIPGLLGLSLFITLGLSTIFSNMMIGQVFMWTLIGGISHVLFDLLNSYGVALLYPLNRKKYSLNLLMIYDPMLIILCSYLILRGGSGLKENIILTFIFFVYLLYRRLDQYRLYKRLKGLLNGEGVKKIEIMPATFHPFKWDFVVETIRHFHVGEISSFKGRTYFLRKLKKIQNKLIQKSLKEELGVYFTSFTPLVHVDVIEKEKEKVLIKMMDLRYRLKNQFMHHALFYYCKSSDELLDSSFYPFHLEDRIKLYENNQ